MYIVAVYIRGGTIREVVFVTVSVWVDNQFDLKWS